MLHTLLLSKLCHGCLNLGLVHIRHLPLLDLAKGTGNWAMGLSVKSGAQGGRVAQKRQLCLPLNLQ